MSSTFFANLRNNPELKSLYEISLLSPQIQLQEYFLEVMTTLSKYFPIGYAAIILQDAKKGSLHVEALYGTEMENHPHHCQSRKGIIGEVLQSRQPMPIQNVNQEPLYEEAIKSPKQTDKMQPPLLCIPLIDESETIGVMNINPLYGSRDEFAQDFHFLSILSAILSPTIRNYHLKKAELHGGSRRAKLKTSLLEEILEERLTEVLNKIDPYVESKSRTGLLDDITSLVEKILIKSAMKKVGYVQTSAAKLLGINRNTLRTKMKELKIKPR
ncbi:MAG: GAF domain-containing protein [Deltaproteobacteria bacterium]|nr:GAF domain-containing protein [Deltaproteobacteria bacterium]